jgi:subtilisin family serine protease
MRQQSMRNSALSRFLVGLLVVATTLITASPSEAAQFSAVSQAFVGGGLNAESISPLERLRSVSLPSLASVEPGPIDTETYFVETVSWAVGVVESQALGQGVAVTDAVDRVVDGFTAELDAAQLSVLEDSPFVIGVYEHQQFSADSSQNDASWGLSRLDQTAPPVDGTYVYPETAGDGVRIYVVDSGVSANPGQFGTRLVQGQNFVLDGARSNLDTSDCGTGHGTHVAGTAASTSYGVAKLAIVVHVRVLGCSGPHSSSRLGS